MWFISDIIERYTSNVARTFLKLAAKEAEANQRALQEMRARRRSQYASPAEDETDAELVTRPAMVHPHTGEALNGATAKEPAVHVEKGFARPQPAEATDPGTLLRQRTKAALRTLPMGVRGEVVVSYVNALIGAKEEEVTRVVAKLGKDKKVRVAELEVIVAAVLDEEPMRRKKADHLAVLRRHLLDPVERSLAKGAAAPHAIPAE
jgi:hypothetical protein